MSWRPDLIHKMLFRGTCVCRSELRLAGQGAGAELCGLQVCSRFACSVPDNVELHVSVLTHRCEAYVSF